MKDLGKELKVKSYSYGMDFGADFLAKDINFNFSDNFSQDNNCAINFKLEQNGSILPITLSQSISQPQVYCSLTALIVGFSLGLNLIEISNYLKNSKNLAGRMKIIKGLKNSIIIDDTYNSSPESAVSALWSLGKIKTEKNSQKIIVFGEMLELGNYSEEGHRLVGEKAVENGVDSIFLIGDKTSGIAFGAIEKGFSKDNIFYFSNIDEVSKALKEKISVGDIILVKASQGGRLEKVVKEIMAEPNRAPELLVRQGSAWT